MTAQEFVQALDRENQALLRRLLLRFATSPEAQEAARRAAARTLSLAEELQTAALRTAGIHHAPGC